MNELETEILFLRQAIVAQRVRATLAPSQPKPAYQEARLPMPEGNGKRASERQVGIASCPLAPEPKLTTRGKRSQEGIVKRQIAQNEAEIAKLKAELGIE